jgi:predicted aldo/keto reductase-like oxidoreductase
MVYRDYGTTGKKVSLLGFGGMRPVRRAKDRLAFGIQGNF